MRKAVLVILDGFGLSLNTQGNAIAKAYTPYLDHWMRHCPWRALGASGVDVGLPPHQMGNSEVGHLTLGAGRVLRQGLTRIDHAIQTGQFQTNPTLLNFIQTLTQAQSACHVMGLFSKGGVHAHEEHMLHTLDILLSHGIQVYLHLFLDGRDTPPQAALHSLNRIPNHPNLIPATIQGRFYAMDRDQRTERTDQAYDAIARGEAACYASSFADAVQQSYDQGITDEFMKPCVIHHHTQPYPGIQRGEGVMHMNFRADRVRQLLTHLVKDYHETCPFVGMSDYSRDLSRHVKSLFPHEIVHDGLCQTLARYTKKILKIAETEKYAHVTFFFNGGVEEPVAGEDRILIASPNVETYDQAPDMSASALTDAVCTCMTQDYDLIVVNFANPDMVGHTGMMGPTVHAIEHVDTCLGRIADRAHEQGYSVFITADHGNAEIMETCDDTGVCTPHTAHTCEPVPFIQISERYQTCLAHTHEPFVLRPDHLTIHGTLSDVAPTLLDFLGIPRPKGMTGISCLVPDMKNSI